MSIRLLDRNTIVNLTLVLESILLLVGACWIQIAQIDIMPLFRSHREAWFIGIFSGIVTACSGFMILFIAKFLGNYFSWLKELRAIVYEEIAPLFEHVSVADVLLISMASGFCEESFFRGIVQNQLGLLPTSLLFGFFHCPTAKHLTYGIWAFAAGLFFSFLEIKTKTLWAPIVAHSLSNIIVILALRTLRTKPGNTAAV